MRLLILFVAVGLVSVGLLACNSEPEPRPTGTNEEALEVLIDLHRQVSASLEVAVQSGYITEDDSARFSYPARLQLPMGPPLFVIGRVLDVNDGEIVVRSFLSRDRRQLFSGESFTFPIGDLAEVRRGPNPISIDDLDVDELVLVQLRHQPPGDVLLVLGTGVPAPPNADYPMDWLPPEDPSSALARRVTETVQDAVDQGYITLEDQILILPAISGIKSHQFVGRVVDVDQGSVSIETYFNNDPQQSPGGERRSFQLSDQTQIRRGPIPLSASDLALGELVFVEAGDGRNAEHIISTGMPAP